MKSPFKRTFELAKMSAKVALKELGSKSLKSRVEQARIITQSLSQLKGAAMKAGQLLSLDVAEYFPPEAFEILSQLQNSATSSPFREIKSTLELELGTNVFHELQELSESPIASASIAQIHTALWKGQKVALKVQHKGVATAIDSDLKILKQAAKAFCAMSGRSMNLDPLFSEMKSVLEQEVDFLQEAQWLQQYSENLISLNAQEVRFVTPRSFSELTTERVLGMTFEEGVTLNKWLGTSPRYEDKKQLAHLVLDLYCHEFYKCGLVQTDPNFSNFLIQENPEEKLKMVLLDFGATRSYSEEFIGGYVQLLRLVEQRDPKKVIEAAIAFGLADSRESEESWDLFIHLMQVSTEPFLQTFAKGSTAKKEFNFGDQDYANRSIQASRAFAASLKYSPPPHKLIFLHRKLGGLYALLKRLNVEIDVSPYWKKMIREDYP